VSLPKRGTDYPGSYADLLAWFPDDPACLDYLDWLRWRNGFTCPHCSDTRSGGFPTDGALAVAAPAGFRRPPARSSIGHGRL